MLNIFTGRVGPTDFALKPLEKAWLVQEGRVAATRYFAGEDGAKDLLCADPQQKDLCKAVAAVNRRMRKAEEAEEAEAAEMAKEDKGTQRRQRRRRGSPPPIGGRGSPISEETNEAEDPEEAKKAAGVAEAAGKKNVTPVVTQQPAAE